MTISTIDGPRVIGNIVVGVVIAWARATVPTMNREFAVLRRTVKPRFDGTLVIELGS